MQATPAETPLAVVAERSGERLDVAVARLCELSRSQAHRLIQDGAVRVRDRVTTKPSEKLAGGEAITVHLPPVLPAEPQPEDIPLNVIYEDEHLIVVDKPPGMPVHPGPGHSGGTLVNALLAHCPDLQGIGGVQRPGIVHRLDKDTSGLIIAAKHERSHLALSRRLSERKIGKTYLTLVEGRLEPPEAIIDAPIARDPYNRQRMTVRVSNGREAQTRYRVREYLAKYSYLEASPITGRTHQIRVHLASLGHPVAGDTAYGKASPLVPRQFLHAWRLSFQHPVNATQLELEAPLPPDLEAGLNVLRTGA